MEEILDLYSKNIIKRKEFLKLMEKVKPTPHVPNRAVENNSEKKQIDSVINLIGLLSEDVVTEKEFKMLMKRIKPVTNRKAKVRTAPKPLPKVSKHMRDEKEMSNMMKRNGEW